MESPSGAGSWWLYAVPLLAEQGRLSILQNALAATFSSGLIVSILAFLACLVVLASWAGPGGNAWGKLEGRQTIPGPRGLPLIGSLLTMRSLAHRRLAKLAIQFRAVDLMAFSLGDTRVIVTSHPEVAREILHSAAFADRPLKQSAQQLLFGRAIGFAPYGSYWRSLRRIAVSYLFAPPRIAAYEPHRQLEIVHMLEAITADAQADKNGVVRIRTYLQQASLNNIMVSVFGRRYNFDSNCQEARLLQEMVREGFELLGAFNWADHLPVLNLLDPQRVHQRCLALVPKVNAFVRRIIEEHRKMNRGPQPNADFLDLLLSLHGKDKLDDEDMIAVLWEMIFRGTDTTAILTEWIMAELVLHPDIQRRVHAELDTVVGTDKVVKEIDIPKLPYLQAVIKETLRIHPPGPLLSWARLATQDVTVAGHHVPAGTTAMVNMWAITHNSSIWSVPNSFMPERFLSDKFAVDADLRGNDLRLAPFGAGRRVCPGRTLGLATVQLWVARLLHHFEWKEVPGHEVSLQEVLKLSCEMQYPLVVKPVRRISIPFKV